MKEKVFVLGFDGATFDLLKPWAEDGILPTFKMLMEKGTYGKLRSSIPPVTFPAWKCYSTGKNPGKLGVFSFQIVDLLNKRIYFANSSSFQSEEIWDLIGKRGLESIVFDMPTTYPPKKINGIMISGPFATSKDFAYPPQIIDEINDRLGRYEPDVSSLQSEMWANDVITDQILEKIIGVIREGFTVIKFLLKEKEWDLFNPVIYVTDVFQHRLWEEKEEMMRLWVEIDRELGRLVKIARGINIFLMSDHGFGPNKRNIYVNDLLEKGGYLVFRKNFSRIGLSKTEIRKVLSFIKLGFLGDLIPDLLFAESLGFRDNIDWNKTTAFAVADGACGHVYVNTNLTSSEEEREDLRKEISEYINCCFQKEIGVGAEIYPREGIYSGEYVSQGPDLVVVPREEGFPVKSRACDRGFDLSDDRNWFGSHRMDGIFLAYGPQIRSNNEIKDAEIIDIAPTLLHLLNLPIPIDMDGKVLTHKIFRSDSKLFKRQIKFEEEKEYERKRYVLTSDEEKEIADRLKKLGYL